MRYRKILLIFALFLKCTFPLKPNPIKAKFPLKWNLNKTESLFAIISLLYVIMSIKAIYVCWSIGLSGIGIFRDSGLVGKYIGN